MVLVTESETVFCPCLDCASVRVETCFWPGLEPYQTKPISDPYSLLGPTMAISRPRALAT